MNSDIIIITGYLAGILTTASFIPQLVKVLKTRSTRDISLSMFAVICSGMALWLIYGIMLTSWPIILANAVSLTIAGTILTLKIRYK